MTQILNPKKLFGIIQHASSNNNPFPFELDDVMVIMQLIGNSLVQFFVKLHDLPNPGQLPIPDFARQKKTTVRRGRKQ